MGILSVGIIKDQMEGRRLKENAILQVCSFKKIIGERVTYRLVLSDSKYIIKTGLLKSDLFSDIICTYSIIKIEKFKISKIPHKNSLTEAYVIKKYKVLNKSNKLIGSPTKLNRTYEPTINKINEVLNKSNILIGSPTTSNGTYEPAINKVNEDLNKSNKLIGSPTTSNGTYEPAINKVNEVLNKSNKLIGSPTTSNGTYEPAINKVSRPVPKILLKNINKIFKKNKLFSIKWTGQIIDIDHDIMYKQCPNDKKKMINIMDSSYCRNCEKFYKDSEYNYMYFIKLKLRDSSKRICRAICFGPIGNKILGKTVKEMVDLQKRNELEFKYYIASRIYLTYTLTLQKDKYKSNNLIFAIKDVL